MTNPFDSYRPPEGARPRTKAERRAARRSGDGGREEKMVPKARFDSYYGTPVVKAPPWKSPIGIYLFLGGVAGGSSLLALGSQLSGNKALRRSARIAAFGAAASGSLALIADLGRPERMLNMFRVFKLSSPMNMGSWILGSFGATSALAALPEIDDLTGHWVPLPDTVRTLLHTVVGPVGGAAAGAVGAPLAVYTAVLLGDTSNPVWNEVKDTLPFVFVSSASLASAGSAMVFTPTKDAGPARLVAIAGSTADLVATKKMMDKADPVIEDSMHSGRSGTMLRLSERCVAAGLVGTLLGARRSRKLAVASGIALMVGSALTRFGILYAGLDSVKDPRCVIEPQKRRLRARQEAGTVNDSITTAR